MSISVVLLLLGGGGLIGFLLAVGGSLLFGAGWGLAGFCPGPALVALGRAAPSALLFVGAMLLGMLAFELFDRYLKNPAPRVAVRS